MDVFFKKAIRFFLLLFHLPFLYFVKSKFKKKLPKRFILACNHPNYNDGGMINLLFYWKYKKDLAIFAHEKYKNKFPMSIFIYSGECIIVSDKDRSKSLRDAAKEEKRSFCLFIEGQKISKKKTKAKTGCIRLSLKTGLPVVPVKIVNKGIFRIVKIGKPIYFLEDCSIREETDLLLEKIYAL